MNARPIMSITDPGVLDSIYTEACVNFRKSTALYERDRYHDLCQALENLYPEQIKAIRKARK